MKYEVLMVIIIMLLLKSWDFALCRFVGRCLVTSAPEDGDSIFL
jgi:hypothetical protein